jgi:hypothetical protein
MQYRRIRRQSSNGNYFIHRALQRRLQLAVSLVMSQLENVLQKRNHQCKKTYLFKSYLFETDKFFYSDTDNGAQVALYWK